MRVSRLVPQVFEYVRNRGTATRRFPWANKINSVEEKSPATVKCVRRATRDEDHRGQHYLLETSQTSANPQIRAGDRSINSAFGYTYETTAERSTVTRR